MTRRRRAPLEPVWRQNQRMAWFAIVIGLIVALGLIALAIAGLRKSPSDHSPKSRWTGADYGVGSGMPWSGDTGASSPDGHHSHHGGGSHHHGSHGSHDGGGGGHGGGGGFDGGGGGGHH